MKRSFLFVIIPGVVIILFVISQLQSCKHEPLIIDKLEPVCFETQVLPIFQNSCTLSGCHNSESAKEGFVASDYQSIMEFVKPGKPNESMVYKVLGREYGEIMPPDKPLSQEQRMLIEVWIAQGAKNNSCGNDSINVPKSDTICFNQDILPFMRSSCGTTGCHDEITKREGYDLTSYASITQRSSSVVPFKPNESKLYKVMVANGGDMMPPTGHLSSELIEKFKKWIEQGALNSDCPDAGCDTIANISFSTSVWTVIQNNCLGCHGGTNPSGNVSLANYTQIKSYAEGTRNSTPILVGAIRHDAGFNSMPPSGKIDLCSIRKIELWITQGSLNN